MSKFRCILCGRLYIPGKIFKCHCGGLLEVEHEFSSISHELFDNRQGSTKRPYCSGVWRFKELIYPNIGEVDIITRPEGNTNLYTHQILAEYVGLKKLSLKHEGENPTGSFKDRGMTVGITEAKQLGAKIVACASTGNTSASLAAYAAMAGLDCVVFIPEDEIAYGKLAQALSYGAKVLQIKGNFDDAMRIVQEASDELELYLLNSVNPWRIEGQKSIIFELLQQREWNPPDWIIFPAGNLGNTSAFGKAIEELETLDLIHELPHLAAIQAEGSNPFYKLWKDGEEHIKPIKPKTIASAIKIGSPVSWRKALKAIQKTSGQVNQVSDEEIMDAKAMVDRSGIGCEPASAASVAGLKKLVEKEIIGPDEDAVCILTGNLLKDPESSVRYHTGSLEAVQPRFPNPPIIIEANLSNIEKVLRMQIKQKVHTGRIQYSNVIFSRNGRL